MGIIDRLRSRWTSSRGRMKKRIRTKRRRGAVHGCACEYVCLSVDLHGREARRECVRAYLRVAVGVCISKREGKRGRERDKREKKRLKD